MRAVDLYSLRLLVAPPWLCPGSAPALGSALPGITCIPGRTLPKNVTGLHRGSAGLRTARRAPLVAPLLLLRRFGDRGILNWDGGGSSGSRGPLSAAGKPAAAAGGAARW